MPSQGAELSPRVVRLRPPLFQRADPIVMVMSQRQERLDQTVARIVAERPDRRLRAQKSGMLFGMEEETEQCVADRQLAVDRREGGVDLPEIGAFDLLGVDLAARDRQDRLARPARLLLCTLECGLPFQALGHQPFLLPLVGVFVQAVAEAMPAAPGVIGLKVLLPQRLDMAQQVRLRRVRRSALPDRQPFLPPGLPVLVDALAKSTLAAPVPVCRYTVQPQRPDVPQQLVFGSGPGI